ncbi:putative transcriptional regulator [Paenibacillus anaericanus]|uniref:ArsR/SmtB family transcription factor n=1 Tax=Paenibacillus anaericanus TaxID=170367 RepID=UPI00277E0DCD|nr:helix-turn-helix domain-containing protein [Paenibacillus anaericanus]MDQ0090031.1 putative transcriptional regulator [Paenibacillus anaericanus]
MEQMILTSLEDIRVYSDPYRLQIMNTFFNMDRPATVKEIADELGEVPAKVHYHVKKLEKIGLLKLVSTKNIKGIIAKYYLPFDGDIQIKHADASLPVQKMIISESQKLINNIFEQKKARFLGFVGSSEKPFGQLADLALYMTKEESEELIQKIREMCAPFEDKRENLAKHDFFLSLVKDPGSVKEADEKDNEPS